MACGIQTSCWCRVSTVEVVLSGVTDRLLRRRRGPGLRGARTAFSKRSKSSSTAGSPNGQIWVTRDPGALPLVEGRPGRRVRQARPRTGWRHDRPPGRSSTLSKTEAGSTSSLVAWQEVHHRSKAARDQRHTSDRQVTDMVGKGASYDGVLAQDSGPRPRPPRGPSEGGVR